MSLPRIILVAVLVTLKVPSAHAALITWEFAGITSGPVFAEIPSGTSVHLAWTFDNGEPNACAGHQQGGGRYFNQSIVMTIGDTLVYQASGILEAGTRILGCGWPIIFPEMDLRMFGWSGPDLSDCVLDRTGGSLPPLMFWGANPPSGAFPSEPPLTTFLLAPRFNCTGSPRVRSVTAQLQFVNAVPEPTTILLVTTGCAAAWIRRRRWDAK